MKIYKLCLIIILFASCAAPGYHVRVPQSNIPEIFNKTYGDVTAFQLTNKPDGEVLKMYSNSYYVVDSIGNVYFVVINKQNPSTVKPYQTQFVCGKCVTEHNKGIDRECTHY